MSGDAKAASRPTGRGQGWRERWGRWGLGSVPGVTIDPSTPPALFSSGDEPALDPNAPRTATATVPRQAAPVDPDPGTALAPVPALPGELGLGDPATDARVAPPSADPATGGWPWAIPGALAPVERLARRVAASPLAARAWRHAPVVLIGLAVLVGGVLRFATPSHLWLDEALTVEIARRPVGGLLTALRHDGSPPLYYLLLHVWIKIFGDGDVAVRALSGVLSLATLPLAWVAGIRAGALATAHGNGDAGTPRRVARATLLLFASSPYAIRYGSETRMYSMVVLLALAFGLAVVRALEKSSVRRLALVTLATAALVYTHYWTFLLVFTVAAFLLLQSRRRAAYQRPTLRAFAAMAASAILFAPWMPSFLFQMLHTGTPWAPRVQAQVLLDTVFDWAGPQSTGALLGLILLGGALLGLTARPNGRELAVKISGRMPGRYLAAVWLVPLTLAWVVNLFGGSAYTERYTGISLPACLMLAALGLSLLTSRRWRSGVLVVATLSGLIGGFQLSRVERTQAGEIAAAIAAQARPGDVVAFCPDQLGPAVFRALNRLGETDLREYSYADTSGPALVDWVDYAARMQRANGADFARQMNTVAGPDHAIFLVKADGYKFLESSCSLVSEQLGVVRDGSVLVTKLPLFEGAGLERFSTLR
ncbi:glycosyltransferase family 39 protein [Frankia sp. AgB1.9]|nr:glycosyltransferase family 39 protein [Frankia sp. AgW1.1]MBL7552953.1 glycosyltransferase family 39 protein [Frankia sp. AgB1.9]MBL7618284.1 glycosyltransferase family 39 protein [Frankia sp. AgB1.8]